MADHTLRAALAWALVGWAEADRCAEASAALAADFEAELRGRRDRAVEALDEHILLREELRLAQLARDEALRERDEARAVLAEATAHGHRWDAQRLREAAAAVRDHDRPDAVDVGAGGA